ncbi:MAG: sirohydrochlorin chelatase [Planctomycetota bacterium]|jgi:sirohydrochlorin cobaltochelatase
MEPETIILVGHGGVPSDFPPRELSELKQLESARMRAGGGPMSEREAELDAKIRGWPRTPETEPYHFGLAAVADALRRRLPDAHVVTAYNEFCAPSVDDCIEQLARGGATRITLVTTMFTPGGSHSECEIPALVIEARKAHPDVDIRYVWPYDLDQAAAFLAGAIASHRPVAGRGAEAAS